ncbi:hypothetical protein D3C77_752720 [compost metagenome]
MVDELTGHRSPGVIDQGFNLGVLAQTCLDCRQIARLSEVCRKNVYRYTGFLVQTHG